MSITVEKAVFEGISFIRDSGKVDMFNRRKVAHLCMEMGFQESAFWIMDNPGDYGRGILSGFKVLKETSDRK